MKKNTCLSKHYFLARYPATLVLFFAGEFSTLALSLIKPTTTSSTLFTPSHKAQYSSEFLSKAFFVNSIVRGTSLAFEIWPGVYNKKNQSRPIITIPYK